MRVHRVVYCSWSTYKQEEWDHAKRVAQEDGSKLEDVLEFEFRKVQTREPLLCSLTEMVRAKALSAYQEVRVPCVVEHGGLILRGYESKDYPGGLTQPMWDALGPEQFLKACRALSTDAVARAVVGYCDGAKIATFIGDTRGSLSERPKGLRQFYWDTVFCPEGFSGKTYAEIADDDLSEKLRVSQSIKAVRQLPAFIKVNRSPIFPGL
jgi:inosine/xanthosine triphosphate pyrophosphatase family protein